jgi:HEAT repeat protein
VVLFGPSARRAIPALIRQVNNANDLSPQSNAIIALGQLVPVSKDQAFGKMAADALIQALNSQQAITRYQAAMSLGYCGNWARPAVPKLSQMINDRSSWETRKAVCFALGWAGRDEQGNPDIMALQALINAIDDPSKEVRMEALQSLINLGPPTGGPSAQMKTLLQRRLTADRDKAVAIWVRVCIMRMDEKAINDENLTVLANLLKDSDTDIAIQAARAFYFIGRESKAKLNELMAALSHEDARMRLQIVQTLERIGPAAERAIPMLESMAENDKTEGVREAARNAVKTLKTTKPAQPGK